LRLRSSSAKRTGGIAMITSIGIGSSDFALGNPDTPA
jgi:hypothetical protein